MVNRNCRATLRLVTLINRQGHPHPPLSSSPSGHISHSYIILPFSIAFVFLTVLCFYSGTGIDACWKQLQRNNVHGEHKIVSFFSPLASSLKTRQWGVNIQSRCYGSASVLVQRNPKFSKLNDEDVRYFEGILGAKNVIQDDEKLITANTDWMRKYKGSSKLLLQPRTTDQVSEILKYCNFRCLAVVPQGGNTGLVGGSVPVFDEVVVSLSAMSKIISFDKVSGILVCEAGCILENIISFLDNEG
ncbi:hypothetical protein Ahy_B05g079269 isoform B [Arachis hypogaea]|nr:hypothetical protein Ahy_B05g079269 isoform B [Arachis hypogaea]